MSQATTHTVRFDPIVVAPSYNNDGTVVGLLEGIDPSLPVIVVNDGSTDDTAAQLDALEARHPQLIVLTHEKNLGKAAALRTGFEEACRLGQTHAVTIDTDSQHDPDQIPDLLSLARREPDALVVGSRQLPLSEYPWRSFIGRWVSNALLFLESGCRVSDSQSGFRVYPLTLVRTVRCRGQRFMYETEIIARCRWHGFRVVEAPIRSRYLPPREWVSHFNPWLDSLRSVGLHLRLAAGCFGLWTRLGQLLTSRARDEPLRSEDPVEAKSVSQ